MKKNLYYKHVFGRKNAIKELILNLFITICSLPRLLLEVFSRKNFGERYFSFSTAVIITVFLSLIPFQVATFSSYYSGGFSFWETLSKYATWYLFLAAFMYQCVLRRREVKRLPSVFDFSRFSLSTGNINPGFYNLKIGGKTPDIRKIETLYEPAVFFIIGLVLALAQQRIGFVIVFCSIVYSLSYVAAYHIGDNFVMDKIDEMICSEELVSSFVDGKDSSETRGFNTYGRKPADPELRKKVVDSFFEQDDFVEAF